MESKLETNGDDVLLNSDELNYTNTNQFTSEIYKVEIRNMGIFGIKEFKKLLKNQFQLDASKIKSPKKRDFAYVCFRSKEDQQKAIEKLNGFRWKGKDLKALLAKATPDPLVKRRLEGTSNNDGNTAKRSKTSAEATCPLASLPYAEQLEKKQSEMKDVLCSFNKDLKRLNSDFKGAADNMPCEFLGIRPSPAIEGYRNKSEFSIGKNADGKIVVGFRLGSYSDGSIEVGSLDGVVVLPENAKLAAKSFEEYATSSKFEIFNPDGNKGHFKQLTVRTSKINNAIMIIVGVYSDNLKENEVIELKKEVTEFYQNYDKIKCTCLYYQDLKRHQPGEKRFTPVEHLFGETHISDEILGLKFRISPLSFFQINTSSAEVLYQQAIDLSKPNKNSSILDICCGTGSIGLCFSKYCKEVLGVELVPEAIKDAEFNANENNITNCKFFAGNCDDYIQSMIRTAVYGALNTEDLDIIAILDPTRAGLHNRTIQALRSAKHLNRLVYISCNPKSAKQNWIDLGRPESKQYKGEPFYPKTAVAVDMFPQTSHTEMIVLFERSNATETSDRSTSNKEEIDETSKPTVALPDKTDIVVDLSAEMTNDATKTLDS